MGKLALLFSGQGSQYIGMGKAFYDQFAIARQTFEEANDVLGFDLKKICFEGNIGELNKLENTLLALLTYSVAAFRVYMLEIGIKPDFTTGHSLGEYSALTCCGAMEFKDSLNIVRFRGEIAKEVANSDIGGMTIVNNMEAGRVEEICRRASKDREFVTVSCYNAKDQTAISGHKSAVMDAESMLLDEGAHITPLIMSAPFHCAMLDKESEYLEKELSMYNFKSLEWPVISNVNALPYKDAGYIVENLKNQFKKPVRWWDTMNYLQDQGVTVYVEMGPLSVLKNLVKSQIKGIKAFSYGSERERQELMSIFQKQDKAEKSNKEYRTVITKSLVMAVSTKNRNSSDEEYIKGVIEPYERLEKIQNYLDYRQQEPSIEEMKEALKILKIIFDTKRVFHKEQIKLFSRIVSETYTEGLLRDFLLKELKLDGIEFIKPKAR